MAYGRFATPRFYMDNTNWLASRGVLRSSLYSNNTGAGFAPINSGFNIYQLFDQNPSNLCSFDVNGTTNAVSVTVDYTADITTDFICIMNHNLGSAFGKFRVAHSASPITTIGGGTVVVAAEILNGVISGSNIITPGDDGDTLITFTSSSDRYWVVEFYHTTPPGAWSPSKDLTIGQIVLGKYYTMSRTPDLDVSRNISFGGVSINESVGGKSYGHASWLSSGGDSSYAPFSVDTDEEYFFQVPGRDEIQFSTSLVADTDIFPADRATYTGANMLNDVVAKSNMNLNPFIFSSNADSTTTGDYMWSRFDQNTFGSIQQAYKYYNIQTLKIIQEF